MTKRQKFVLDRIRELNRRSGCFPTVREIAAAAGLSSPATAQAYLKRLHAIGALLRRGRFWGLVDEHSSVPLMGVVPAGSPLEIFENLGDEVALPDWLAERGSDTVAFRVQGQSMKDAYIQDGDLVVVRRTPHADAGQMVVARLPDGSITLKRLKRDQDAYVLVPENPEYAVIATPFQVVGRVVGVLRKYR